MTDSRIVGASRTLEKTEVTVRTWVSAGRVASATPASRTRVAVDGRRASTHTVRTAGGGATVSAATAPVSRTAGRSASLVTVAGETFSGTRGPEDGEGCPPAPHYPAAVLAAATPCSTWEDTVDITGRGRRRERRLCFGHVPRHHAISISYIKQSIIT